jgi:hypothetical protein
MRTIKNENEFKTYRAPELYPYGSALDLIEEAEAHIGGRLNVPIEASYSAVPSGLTPPLIN